MPKDHEDQTHPRNIDYLGPTRARMEPAPDVPPGPRGDLARLIRQRRVERGLSQSHLASEMSRLGHQWHQTTVVKTERAEREPRYTELLALAQILRITPASLLDTGLDGQNTDLAALQQQERLLTLQADLQDRDLALLEVARKDTRERLREVRRAVTAARKTKAITDS